MDGWHKILVEAPLLIYSSPRILAYFMDLLDKVKRVILLFNYIMEGARKHSEWEAKYFFNVLGVIITARTYNLIC